MVYILLYQRSVSRYRISGMNIKMAGKIDIDSWYARWLILVKDDARHISL